VSESTRAVFDFTSDTTAYDPNETFAVTLTIGRFLSEPAVQLDG